MRLATSRDAFCCLCARRSGPSFKTTIIAGRRFCVRWQDIIRGNPVVDNDDEDWLPRDLPDHVQSNCPLSLRIFRTSPYTEEYSIWGPTAFHHMVDEQAYLGALRSLDPAAWRVSLL